MRTVTVVGAIALLVVLAATALVRPVVFASLGDPGDAAPGSVPGSGRVAASLLPTEELP